MACEWTLLTVNRSFGTRQEVRRLRVQSSGRHPRARLPLVERLLREAEDETLRPLAGLGSIYPFMVVGRLADAGATADELVEATHGRLELGLDHW